MPQFINCSITAEAEIQRPVTNRFAFLLKFLLHGHAYDLIAPVGESCERRVQAYADGGRKVQAAFFGLLGNSDGGFGVLCDQGKRQARGFAAEDEAVSLLGGEIPERSRGFAGEKDQAGILHRGEEGVGVIMHGQF